MGGFEFVYSKKLEALAVGDLEIRGFEIQVGAMDYGFPLQGLIGTDFLVATRAIVDLVLAAAGRGPQLSASVEPAGRP